jgi:hypothetical protein
MDYCRVNYVLTVCDGSSMADGKHTDKRGKSQYSYEFFRCIVHRAVVNGYSLCSVLGNRNTEMSVLRVRS